MGNVTDITQRLPIRQFTPRIVDHSRVEAFEAAPAEMLIGAYSGSLYAVALQIAHLGGVERMEAEMLAVIASVRSAVEVSR